MNVTFQITNRGGKMITLNYRRFYIMEQLLNEQQPLKIPDLSQKLKCSERSIRYDLKIIDTWLTNHGLSTITQKHAEGVFYYYNKEEKQTILLEMNAITSFEYEFNRKERVGLINLILLTSTHTLTIKKIEQLFQMSRGTILADLEVVEKKLAKYKLVFKRQRGLGIWIEGPEVNRRQMLIHLKRNINEQSLNILTTEYINNQDNIKKQNFLSSIDTIMNQLEIDKIQFVVEPLLKVLGINFSDNGQLSLYLHIGMALKRLKSNHTVSFQDKYIEDIFNTREYHVATLLKQQIERVFQIELPKEEIAYIALYLLSNQRAPTLPSTVDKTSHKRLTQCISRMTLQIETALNIKFDNRDELLKGLLLHLRPAIYRSKYGLVTENYLMHEVKRDFHDLYQAVQTAVKEVETTFNMNFKEEEIAYITMHYCGFLPKLSRTEKIEVRVLIVCTSGLGTANLLKNRVNTAFENIEIIETLSYSSYIAKKDWKVDLIISTIDLPNASLPVIKVDPLLPEEDYEKLSLYLRPKQEEVYQFTAQEIYEAVWPIINKHCLIDNPAKLTEDLINSFDSLLHSRSNGIPVNSLEDALTGQYIQLDKEVKSWKEAITLGAKPLEQTGVIGEAHKHGIIDIIEERGPYMAVAPGIMLAHGNAQDVEKVSLSFTRLSPPVKFNHAKNDPIELLFIFVSPEETGFIPALQQLLEHLIDPETRSALISAKTVSQTLDILSRRNIRGDLLCKN